MQIIARTKEIRVSPRKVRLVADSVRNMSIDEAMDALSVIDKRGAYGLSKTLKAAVANATNNASLNKNDLFIKSIDINEGTSIKRFHPSTRGRVHPYKKRSSGIRIVLEEKVINVKAIEAPKNVEIKNEIKEEEK